MRNLNETGQARVADYADDLNRSGLYPRTGSSISTSDFLDTYSVASAAAGGGAYNEDSYTAYHKLRADQVPEDYDAQVDVHGDSMEPTLLDGDVAFISFSFSRKNGEVYVVQVDEDTLIKRCFFAPDSVTLRSDNSAYEDRIISTDQRDSSRIIGKVVGHATPQ